MLKDYVRALRGPANISISSFPSSPEELSKISNPKSRIQSLKSRKQDDSRLTYRLVCGFAIDLCVDTFISSFDQNIQERDRSFVLQFHGELDAASFAVQVAEEVIQFVLTMWPHHKSIVSYQSQRMASAQFPRKPCLQKQTSPDLTIFHLSCIYPAPSFILHLILQLFIYPALIKHSWYVCLVWLSYSWWRTSCPKCTVFWWYMLLNYIE